MAVKDECKETEFRRIITLTHEVTDTVCRIVLHFLSSDEKKSATVGMRYNAPFPGSTPE